MPRFDRTGPWGEGPMTGGGFGYCNPASGDYRRPWASGPWASGSGRGMGRGSGRFRGRNRGSARYGGTWAGWNWAPNERPFTQEPRDELRALRGEARAAKKDLDAINKRIQELESETSDIEQ